MAKREKASRTYRDSSDDDVEIFGSTQGSGAPGTSKFTASSKPAKRYAAVFFARRQRYNYIGDSDADYGD